MICARNMAEIITHLDYFTLKECWINLRMRKSKLPKGLVFIKVGRSTGCFKTDRQFHIGITRWRWLLLKSFLWIINVRSQEFVFVHFISSTNIHQQMSLCIYSDVHETMIFSKYSPFAVTTYVNRSRTLLATFTFNANDLFQVSSRDWNVSVHCILQVASQEEITWIVI